MSTISYRLGQVRQQLGFVAPLSVAEYEAVARFLPESALMLFQTMSPADQRHSLRVCQGLQARGCDEADMLAAALLHDVGKAQGRVPFWTRPVLVLGKLLFPRLLARVTVYPSKGRHYRAVDVRSVMPGIMPRWEPNWRRRLGCQNELYCIFAPITSHEGLRGNYMQ